MMKWDEINRRLKNGTSVKILAELDGVDYKTMYNRIRQHERKDGKTYMKDSQMRAKRKPPKEEKKPWFLESSCETCLHRKESPETKEEYCAMGHKYEGPAGVCSEWSDLTPGKTVELPEVVPKLPEDIDSETIAGILRDINRQHADAVKELHRFEEILTKARNNEIVLRTLLIAMEQLAKGRKLPEGDGNG